jgi:hypothetical protein
MGKTTTEPELVRQHREHPKHHGHDRLDPARDTDRTTSVPLGAATCLTIVTQTLVCRARFLTTRGEPRAVVWMKFGHRVD